MFLRESVEGDDENREPVDDRYIMRGLAVIAIICMGIFFCIPVVIIALDFATTVVHVCLIVSFVIVFGVTIGWSSSSVLFPVALMIAYFAVLVNIDVGGR